MTFYKGTGRLIPILSGASFFQQAVRLMLCHSWMEGHNDTVQTQQLFYHSRKGDPVDMLIRSFPSACCKVLAHRPAFQHWPPSSVRLPQPSRSRKLVCLPQVKLPAGPFVLSPNCSISDLSTGWWFYKTWTFWIY